MSPVKKLSLNWQSFDLSIFDLLIKLRHCLTDLRKKSILHLSLYISCVPRNTPTLLSYTECDSKAEACG